MLPLQGIRVVEIGVVIAGPAAAALLGDWGAEVIKVEPLDGDPARGNPAKSYFQLDNRGKRSMAVDIASPEGLGIVLALLDSADVFVTNLRARALTRLGLDPASLAARNPRLVYASVSGYGPTGPAEDKPGYDIGAFWSRAGVAAALVGPGNEPPVSRPGMGDHTTALSLVSGILAALLERGRTGRGQTVSTSLMRAGTYFISSDISALLNGDRPQSGLRRAMYNPLLACYQAADSRWFWLLGLQAWRHWPNVLAAVGRTELLDDARFSSFTALTTHREEVMSVLDAEFARRPLSEWAPIFDAHDVWWDPVQDLDEVVADPLFEACGAVRPMVGGVRTIAPPADLAHHDLGPAGPAPETGQHTEEILLELGYDWDRIAHLKKSSTVG
ncbi:MAG: CaiB/BaiF CoA-transferase family protein [Actinomycetota bacterium]|nr:CaiB/BaiF CoA-transferase family protein [Actinomycetota bacterium]